MEKEFTKFLENEVKRNGLSEELLSNSKKRG